MHGRQRLLTPLVWLLCAASSCCAATTEQEFAKYARLELSGRLTHRPEQVQFRLWFATTGPTLWPPFGIQDLRFYVDGRETEKPAAWSEYALTQHILPRGGGHSLNWSRTEDELKTTLGPGEHELFFLFGDVESNVLRVEVPRDGRLLFAPRTVIPYWPSVRGPWHKRPSKSSESELHKVAWNGSERGLRRLVAEGAQLDARNSYAETPLHYAAMRGFRDLVRILADAGANVNAQAQEGWTALHEAATQGDERMAELLILAGADVNASDGLGRTPLRLAARWGDRGTVNVLLGMGAEQDIFTASALGELGLATRMLTAEPELATKREKRYGSPPLHVAAEAGHADVVELLLTHGGALDAADNEGLTALHLAARRGHAEMVKLLLSEGPQVDTRDEVRQTALHLAAEAGHSEAVELLLSGGADPNATDERGKTPLHLAASSDYPEVVGLLISAGGRVKAKDDQGRTPMHYADSTEVVGRLVAGGASVEATDRQGLTPLFLAAGTGRKTVVAALLANEAEPNVSVRVLHPEGMLLFGTSTTPLEMAEFHGHREAVEILRKYGATE